jgi:biotin transporter BioY
MNMVKTYLNKIAFLLKSIFSQFMLFISSYIIIIALAICISFAIINSLRNNANNHFDYTEKNLIINTKLQQ